MRPLAKQIFLFSFLLSCAFDMFAQQSKLDSLKRKALSLPNDTTKVLALNRFAKAAANSGEMDSAMLYFQRSLDLSLQLKYHYGISAGLNSLGRIYLNQGASSKLLKKYSCASG